MITIQGYQIIKKLGQGGMAAVYLAKEEGLKREVALKILTLHVTDETFKKNFLAEARLVATLEHQHIIRIYRVGVEDDQFYMEMELLRKGTLKERLEKNILSVPDALSLIKQIASALSYAHKKGYVHRDIKPANILFRTDDEVVLADFGIAKAEGSKGDLTRAGHSGFGTPDYMPPEQAVGDAVDGRSDLYSLAIVFYEMLTRSKPFHADTTAATIRQHMIAEVPPLPENYAYFQPVLDKALAKEKEDRYADVITFCNALMLAEENNTNPNADDRTVVYPSPQAADSSTQDNTQARPQAHSHSEQPQAHTYSTQENTVQRPYQPTPPQQQRERDTKLYTRPWQIPNHKSSEQLIISFIDIKSSTNMTEEMGDVAYEAVRNKFEAIIAENTTNFNECALVKMMGDGALIIYADAMYAIQQSLQIQSDVYQHSKENKEAKFALRIGLHLGLVKLETTHKIDVHGAHVNKAARIEGCGRSGTVAMSRALYDMVYPRLKHDANFFWKDLGKQKLKGTYKEKVYLVSSKKIPIDWFKYKFLLLFVFIIGLVVSYFMFDKAAWNKLVDISTTHQIQPNTTISNESAEDRKTNKERQEQEQEEAEKEEAVREAADRERARIEQEKAEQEAAREKARVEQEKAEQEAAAREKARIEQEKVEQEAVDREKARIEQEKAEQEAAVKEEIKQKQERVAEKRQVTDILDSAFKRWKNVCADYKTYRNYGDLLEINATATGGSRSKERMELEGKQDRAEQTLIESFAIFTQSFEGINNISDIDSKLEAYMANRSLSSFKKKRFVKAVTDEIKGNADKSRSNDMKYYKTICK